MVTIPLDDDRVVVIGSGPCGAAATARLVERGVRVTMLDAGTHAPRGLVVKAAGNTLFRSVSTRELTGDRLDPSSDPHVWWGSSLSLGGLSNYWTAAVPRFAPEDFHEGGRIDERYVWPITYDDLVPHYERAERSLGVTVGPESILGIPDNVAAHVRPVPTDWRTFAAAATKAGHGVGLMPMAKGRPWMVARRGAEFCSYQCVIAPLEQHATFELRRGAVALRLGTGRQGVESVEYVDVPSGQARTIRCRAVVVAAGALDSTALLLRSATDGDPVGLGNSCGLIGRYLHDHPREWWVVHVDRPMRALVQPIYVARRRPEDSSPLLATSLTIGLRQPRDRLKTYVRGRATSMGVQVFGTMVPTPDVGVSLGTRGGGCLERPKLSLRYDDATVANLVSGRDRMRQVFADAGIKSLIPGPFHDVHPGSSYHWGGTVRMHSSPEFGAVDRWNRLYEVRNVLVVDGSCFTTGAEKNPTLTAMAIADRAAAHLVDELSGSQTF